MKRQSRRDSHSNWRKVHMVWPKDKPHMGTLDRIKDCFTGEGPDMFVATRSTTKAPHRPIWSNWVSPDLLSHCDQRYPWDNLGYPLAKTTKEPVTKSARRREDHRKRYDFRTRRYVIAHRENRDQIWSDVKWNPQSPNEPWYHRDGRGDKFLSQADPRWRHRDADFDNPFELRPLHEFIFGEAGAESPWVRNDRR